MKQLYSLLFFAFIYVNVQAQLVTRIAGGATGDGGYATQTSVAPTQLVVDNNGIIYFNDFSFNRVRKIQTNGIISTVLNFTVDALQIDNNNNMYYARNSLHQVFKRSSNGVESLFAGNGSAGNSGDSGLAVNAAINMIKEILISPTGNIYLQDTASQQMRYVDASGTIYSILPYNTLYYIASAAYAIGGTSSNYYLYQHVNGSLSKYVFNSPSSITLISSVSVGASTANHIGATTANVVYVPVNNYVYKCTSMFSSGVSVFAGTGVAGYNGDGISASTAQLNFSTTTAGNVFISGSTVYISEYYRIRKIDASNVISTVAGLSQTGAAIAMAGDGLDARMAAFSNISKITKDQSGNLYIVDKNAGRIRKVDVNTNIISTFAGSGSTLGDNGPAINAKLLNPTSITFDNSGNAYIVDQGNQRIRKVDVSGTITTFAGGGTTSLTNTWTTATNMNLGSTLNDIAFLNGKVYFSLFGGNPASPKIVYVNSSGTLTNAGASFANLLTPSSSIFLSGYNSLLYYISFDNANNKVLMQFNTTNLSSTNTYLYCNTFTIDNNTGNIYYTKSDGLHYIDVNNSNFDSLLTANSNSTCFYNGNGLQLNNLCASWFSNSSLYVTNGSILFNYGGRINYVCLNNNVVSGTTNQTFYLDTSINMQKLVDFCNIHAGIQTIGNNPVNGTITSKVSINSSVPTLPNGNPYVQRHYDLEPMASSSYATGKLTLYFTQSEFNNYNTVSGINFPHFPTNPTDTAGIANVRITQVHGTGTNPTNYTGYVGNGPSAVLINPDDSNIIWNSAKNWWEISFNVTGFSGFYLHTTATGMPLAVHLLSFNGQLKDKDNELFWQTSDEQNNAGFEVERSIDAVQFVTIGKVQSKGYDNQANLYTYTDIQPKEPVYYYRLKIWDKNGAYTFSNVVKLERKNIGKPSFVIMPNPASISLIISTTAPGKDFILYDITGRKLIHRPITTEKTTIDISFLSAGVYLYDYGGERGKLVKE
ncbi:MAG: T9SS type A sorting domain-containing protein [Bacteroidetes bacterium]|nr:T9SS type A sorting domain-containing protein [Bacteroidota bacterium]